MIMCGQRFAARRNQATVWAITSSRDVGSMPSLVIAFVLSTMKGCVSSGSDARRPIE